MLDALPMACFCLNDTPNVIACNAETVRLFGMSSKQECLDNFFYLSPTYQPGGVKSRDLASQYVKNTFKTGEMRFKWLHQKLNEEPIPSEIVLKRVDYQEVRFVIGYIRDLREHKQMLETIENKDVLLDTANNIATILFKSEIDEFEENIWRCMGLMAKFASVDRVYIWKNHEKDGQLYCTQVYEWSEEVTSQQGGDFTVDIPYTNIPGWEEKLSSGQCINKLVKNMSAKEQDQLSPQGIISILVVPVFLHDTFWGFFGFDDCRKERTFSTDEEYILRSCSLQVANALIRNNLVQKIRTSAARMEAVIKNYTGIIWSVDKNGTITLFDGLYLKELGMTPDFLEGKNLYTVKLKNSPLGIAENVKKTFSEGPQKWITRVEDRTYRLQTIPIYDESGCITSVVGSAANITEIILLQRNLEIALEKAQAANKAKGNFLANMSHEIRTPMNGILGLLHLALAADMTPKQRDYLEKISMSAKNLLRIINDILDFSKIEDGKLEMESVTFRLSDIFAETIDIFTQKFKEPGLDFDVNISPDLPNIIAGDPLRLKQVLINLINNAIKFTEQGKISVGVEKEHQSESRVELKFFVKDTGIGIAPEQLKNLFKSFSQVDDSVTRKYGGTGLGLIISKSLVEMMGGDIWVESTLGVGSVFYFSAYFDVPESQETPIDARQNTENPPEESQAVEQSPSSENAHILLVDDNKINQLIAVELLTNAGYLADIANNGQEAIDMVLKKDYGIVLMDIQMPVLDGLTATRQLRAMEKYKNLPIIAMSAHAMLEDKEKSLECGMNDHLTKPIDTDIFYETLKKYLS